jgi:YD repeat-containing protein
MRSQWEGVVPLSVAFAPPGSTVLSHNQVEVFYEYDGRGRLFRESKPTWLGTPPDAWTEWSYDNLDRPLESTLLDGSFDQLHQEERWEYDYGALGTGRVVLETYTDQDGKSTRRYFDGAQRVIEAYDGMGTPTAFVYGPFDLLAEVRRGGLFQHDALSITTYGYDRLGRRVAETAPESGTATVGYTPFGEVEVVTVPEGTTAFVHDDLGRVTDRMPMESGVISPTTTGGEPRRRPPPARRARSASSSSTTRVTDSRRSPTQSPDTPSSINTTRSGTTVAPAPSEPRAQ